MKNFKKKPRDRKLSTSDEKLSNYDEILSSSTTTFSELDKPWQEQNKSQTPTETSVKTSQDIFNCPK